MSLGTANIVRTTFLMYWFLSSTSELCQRQLFSISAWSCPIFWQIRQLFWLLLLVLDLYRLASIYWRNLTGSRIHYTLPQNRQKSVDICYGNNAKRLINGGRGDSGNVKRSTDMFSPKKTMSLHTSVLVTRTNNSNLQIWHGSKIIVNKY